MTVLNKDELLIPEEFKSMSLGQMLVNRPSMKLPSAGTFMVPMPRLILANGSWLSVQAGYGLYSSPRDGGVDKYTHVEIMSPVELPPAVFGEFGASEPDVYCYVPLNLICMYIASKGGIDREATFANRTHFLGF